MIKEMKASFETEDVKFITYISCARALKNKKIKIKECLRCLFNRSVPVFSSQLQKLPFDCTESAELNVFS